LCWNAKDENEEGMKIPQTKEVTAAKKEIPVMGN
jgi:hypothetical protein